MLQTVDCNKNRNSDDNNIDKNSSSRFVWYADVSIHELISGTVKE